jgi:hypothetical protein
MSHKISVSRGQKISTVSNQWASRSDDQRFTSLSALHAQVNQWAAESFQSVINPSDVFALYDEAQPDYLALTIGDAPVSPSNWSFEQIARLANAPANYLRSLPGPLAAVNLNYGLRTVEQKQVAAYLRTSENGGTQVRGITSPRYGRIYDRDVVAAVMRVAGDGIGDTRWKVPGTIDWSSKFGISYNPQVNITKDNTTLYASDRDVFLFLVDDYNPIEVGKLPNGDPDLMFRGFYVWNSEVGSKTFGFASMYLRGVCQNRNLWGVEDFNQIVFKHTSGAPERFLEQAEPALLDFANLGESRLISGVKAAKSAVVAKTDEERIEFLGKFGFTQKAAKNIIDICEVEEQKAPESIWDFAQGVTAMARLEPLQEDRVRLELVGGKILDKVKVAA